VLAFTPPDQVERDRAIGERARNVLIDAGAGTGKTTLLVDRLIEMIAPARGDAPAIPIARIAAITFTRKAAGELRLKIRERLLRELGRADLDAARRARLRDGMAGLDTAYVGTIHSFADRLLRLCPVAAALSPSYQIAEDDGALLHETVAVLLHAVQNGLLEAELQGTGLESRAVEATSTVLFALQVGLRAESREREWTVDHGLDALVAGFVHQRDIPPADTAPAEFDADAFRSAADEFLDLARHVRGASAGAAWIARTAAALRRVRESASPLVIMAELKPQLGRAPRNPTRRDTFDGDDAGWVAWTTFKRGGRARATPLEPDLVGPLDRWLATRLVRLFPVVIALHEKVKARHRALDQLDLLVKLRDLLACDRAVRGQLQQLFDHVFVDEFQDTDPLQAEIVLYLCEMVPEASRWEDVALRPGSLTLAGDPKQSIYRFRRADVAMYDRVRGLLAHQDALGVTLSANFRSVPALITWLNDRFDRVLERSPDGRPFDLRTGRVFQQRLDAGRPGGADPAVHVLPFSFPDGDAHKVDEFRRLEAEVLARYLRWLVTASAVRIEDPLDRRPRLVRYGDIAVLAVSTWNLPLLFPRLDAEGIPYASRGGVLFLQDPIHRQFMLGLRAIADRDDGVAEAALMRPPFFALDLADLMMERAASADGPEAESLPVSRARQARALARELRRRRFDRSPGATARDLLDETAFARVVARGANAAQRLVRLRELCLVLEQTAAEEGLDFDAASARLREWVDAPVPLDPPHPVGTEAVQVMTVHQAKGLEFPVVVLWDSRLGWDLRLDQSAWRMERDGRGFVMNLKGLGWEEPPGLGLRATEREYLLAERRRVVYVAATRARDLLVLPKAGAQDPRKLVPSALLDGADPALVRELGRWVNGTEPDWARAVVEGVGPAGADGADLEQEIGARWSAAAVEAARPRFRPAGVSGESHAIRLTEVASEGEVTETSARKPRDGRHGPVFGDTVHRAIGLVLSETSLAAAEAVRRAAVRSGLDQHLDEAAADVDRALGALRAEGLLRPLGADLQVEYPVAGAWGDGLLLTGYIDLVSVSAGRVDVLDFKTDPPPAGGVERAYPHYASQVRLYGHLLEQAGVTGARPPRCGLLFTADGAIRWLS